MKKYTAIGASLLLVISSGCVTSSSTTVEKTGSTYKVVANSLILNDYIRVVERSTRMTNGLLEAQVRGQNMKRRDVQFEYRFVWLDKDGIQIDTQMTTWKPLALSGREIALMTGIAPSPEATDFLMAVRFAHNSTRW